MLKSLNEQMARSVHLTDEQAALAIAQLIDGSVADDLKADFLHGLARKGETAGEISAFARELRAKSRSEVESHFDAPENSEIFKAFPKMLANKVLVTFICLGLLQSIHIQARMAAAAKGRALVS